MVEAYHQELDQLFRDAGFKDVVNVDNADGVQPDIVIREGFSDFIEEMGRVETVIVDDPTEIELGFAHVYTKLSFTATTRVTIDIVTNDFIHTTFRILPGDTTIDLNYINVIAVQFGGKAFIRVRDGDVTRISYNSVDFTRNAVDQYLIDKYVFDPLFSNRYVHGTIGVTYHPHGWIAFDNDGLAIEIDHSRELQGEDLQRMIELFVTRITPCRSHVNSLLMSYGIIERHDEEAAEEVEGMMMNLNIGSK